MEEKILVIGVAGASGSRKTCLAKAIENRLGEKVTFLSHYSYYKRHDEMSYEERCNLNYDDPGFLGQLQVRDKVVPGADVWDIHGQASFDWFVP